MREEIMEPHVIEAMKRIPVLWNFRPDEVECERLGGMANLVYRISTDENDYCLRIPTEGTEEYIDRAVEKHNTMAAVVAGFSPEQFFFSEDGLMLSKFLVGAETVTPDKLRGEPDTAYRLSSILRELHHCGQLFQFRFDVFSMIDKYLEYLSRVKPVKLPDGYLDVVEQSRPIQHVLNENAVELRPCHCDPVCENFLNDDDRMWMVDWEFSGMSDPYWDIGHLSLKSRFTEDQEYEFLFRYLEHEPSESHISRVFLYKVLCDLLWTLWGLIQHVNGNPSQDFWAYLMIRFAVCQELLSSEEFPRHLNTLKKTRES